MITHGRTHTVSVRLGMPRRSCGNDERGIDVGILSHYPIRRMRSHIADRSGDAHTFSRDCPEYYIELPSGRELLILPNHFASKGSDRTGKRRRVQAAAAAKSR
jgi:hypothetical protein